MVKKKDGKASRGKRFETISHRWGKLGKFFLLLCVILIMGSCATMPTENEIIRSREQNARRDVELIKPPMSVDLTQPLTLEDAIRYGLQNNLALRVADFNREIASKETLAHKLKMLPGLVIDGRYEYKDKLRKSDVYNWKEDRDVEDYTVSELKDSGKANLSLTWNVLDTAMAYVRSGQSQMQERLLKERRHRQAQFLALDITEAYWQAAAVEDALDYVHTVIRKLKGVRENIADAVKMRAMDAMDATEADMRLKELEITIRKLQADLSKARLKLAELMGINQNVEFTLYRPPIKPIIAALPHVKELDIDRLEEFALVNRPDLFASDMQVRIQKQEAKNAFLKLFPGVNFFAGTHYDANRLLLSKTWNSVGAGVGWDLLNLPAAYINMKGTEKAVEMAKAQRLMLTVGVITQVHIALLDYAIKIDRFRLLEEAYILADNLLDMAKEKVRYGGRGLTQLDVTQRHLEQMASKLRRDEAVVDMLVAHKRLCVSIGVDPLDCDASILGGTGGVLPAEPLKRWKCTECGYIHTGPRPPERCPICGADRSRFVQYSGEDDSYATGPGAGVGAGLATDMGAGLGNGGDLDTWGKNIAPPPDAGLSRGSRSAPSPGWAGDASDKFLWKLQIGAFTKPAGAAKRIAQIKNADLRLMDPRDTDIETKQLPRFGLVNRVRFKGLTQADARNMANELRRKGMEYWIIPPQSPHW
ncbi:TolC family protein [Desulfonema magnum]|uniref:Outer membrane efflux protein domain-containing protein n=1 Tax=Desulfonema magnum TaxID=45655 RepID=A0A975BXS8_9BACT|nr:TolC family protein [Desulfonema magnum]QTA93653.1 Outer membrane efflux protein domain-containing protein [Desulfonema magnum]